MTKISDTAPLDVAPLVGHSSLGGDTIDPATSGLAGIPASDWARMWATLPARHLPTRISHEIEASVNEFGLRVMMVLSAMGLSCTIMAILTLVPLDTTAGQAWAILHLAHFVVIAGALGFLNLRRRRGRLTARLFNITALPLVIFASALWGALPAIVGTEPIGRFYLASCVAAMLCFFGFFWTAGQWPLSVLYATNICVLVIATFVAQNRAETPLVASMMIGLWVLLLGLSVLSTVALVNARYETVLARERKQMVQLLLRDYERGGHDWLWETDDAFQLTHVPPRMALAADGDRRFRRGASLFDLVAEDPQAAAAVRDGQPFQALVVGGETRESVEVRLWGRPNIVGNRCLGYLGVGSDEGAARRAAVADRTRERLDAMVALTSGLAHDFNNLLATILGSVELATATRDLESDVMLHLDRAADACLRARRITGDLAAAAGHDLTAQSAPFDLAETVRGVIDDVRPLAPDISIEVESDQGPVWALADGGHCARAVRNLVDNALQAIRAQHEPGHGGRLSIEIGSDRDRDGVPVSKLVVSDNGPGIPEHLRHRLFEPFVTTRKANGGTGLGLAVASGFARQSGGDLFLDTPTEGASFRLILPQATRADIDVGQTAAPVNDTAPRVELGGHFLVVEDDLHLADTLAMWIESFGGTTDVADSVERAVAYIADSEVRFECVISDLVLPDGEGFDVIAALRNLRPDTPAVYVSGFTRTLPADVEPRLRCPFVAKPFSTVELLRALSQAGFDLAHERPALATAPDAI